MAFFAGVTDGITAAESKLATTIACAYAHSSEGVAKMLLLPVQVLISYLEIYNETGYDLLDPTREVQAMEDLPQVSRFLAQSSCMTNSRAAVLVVTK